MKPKQFFCGVVLLASSLLWVTPGRGAAAEGDWPLWRFDAGHTAASPHSLPDRLSLLWQRQYSPRQPCWEDRLNRDLMTFDRHFEPVVADGRVFLSFNDSDKVVALDADTGRELWRFYCDGPVRLSPAVADGRVFFTSDDGYLYCLRAEDGRLLWKLRGGPSERKVLGNGRVVSSWPARGGAVVSGRTVYFAASIWPFMGTFIYAVDAETGRVVWVNDGTGADFQLQPHRAPAFAGVAPQGQLAVAGALVLVPGGRSLPAAFDRGNGQLRFFNFGTKGQGGSFVAATVARAFVHTRRRGTVALQLPEGTVTKFEVNEPVLDGEWLYTGVWPEGRSAESDKGRGKATCRVEAYRGERLAWKLEGVDARGDLIKAGRRLYAAGGDGKRSTVTAVDLPDGSRPARVAWTLSVDGQVVRLLAADGKLFAVTSDGRILAFGATTGHGRRSESQPAGGPNVLTETRRPLSPSPNARRQAARLLSRLDEPKSYCFWFGVDDPELLQAFVAQAPSELRVVAVDEDVERVAALRRRFDLAGLYGQRVSVHVGTPQSFQAPPYVARLVVVGRSLSQRLDADGLQRVFRSVRPYGGRLCLLGGAEVQRRVAELVRAAGLERAEAKAEADGLVVMRVGSLPGAAPWTHQYGNVANTCKSDDRRVRAPLGLLWFGGNSNEDVLPRHGHGPSEQVVGGRLFIEGVDSLSARDVYTGRVLWKRRFPVLRELNFGVYFDHTYRWDDQAALSTDYNQVHIPGANARGTNFVATDDAVYLALGNRCLQLDPATGQTVREFVLPEQSGRRVDWAFLGVYENLLLAGTGFADYSERLGYRYKGDKKHGPAWGPDYEASRGLTAFDRRTGRVLWHVDAASSFWHNGIVAGGGRIYVLDRLPKRVEEFLRRRAQRPVQPPRILALDAQTGRVLWQVDRNVFGTWLSYSRQHDLLVEAGAPAVDRSLDEASGRLTVYEASTGRVRWSRTGLNYSGPLILHGDLLIANAVSYREGGGGFSLLDGRPVTVENPLTGEPVRWEFIRAYGCNTAVASECLLTFRSGAAGFYDLLRHGGVGNLGGFKSGCTSNLIVADGVLNAPDYTRTCTCPYQNQTSLALVSMPENEVWTYGLVATKGTPGQPIRRVGLNLGAPGDRLADSGTLWVNWPPDGGPSPQLDVQVTGRPRWFRHHSSRVRSGPLPWVAASGAEGLRSLRLGLTFPPQPKRKGVEWFALSGVGSSKKKSQKGKSDGRGGPQSRTGQPAPAADRPTTARASTPLKERHYRVTLVFAEPDPSVQPGQRVFDVSVQGKTVAEGFDVAKQAGGANRSVRLVVDDVAVRDQLEIRLTPRTDLQPILCGVEVVQQRAAETD